MDQLISLVANLGFPAAVAAYLLIRIEGKLGELTTAITGLRETIITLPGYINRGGLPEGPFTRELNNYGRDNNTVNPA